MAPDRRFGLPHPLDADPSEDSSSPRKAGLWESFKRALGSPPPEASRPSDRPGAPLPVPTPPVAPRTHSSSALPASTGADPPVSNVDRRRLDEVDADVPFLVDDPAEGIPVRAEPDAGNDRIAPAQTIAPETSAASREDSSEPPIGAPKLARGLASFSRRNAEREKKFAHLLRDSAPADSKSRPRGKRG